MGLAPRVTGTEQGAGDNSNYPSERGQSGTYPTGAYPARADAATGAAVVRVVAEIDAETTALDEGRDAAETDLRADAPRTDAIRADDATASTVVRVTADVDAATATTVDGG